ncbi:MAG: histone H1 [Planctomycetaceae bacterium]|nr:histone H1 [Planctomycetaceae bacterium]
MQEFEQLKSVVESAEDEVRKVEAGNKAAGTRVRKLMQEVKAASQAVRTKVLEMRDSGGG